MQKDRTIIKSILLFTCLISGLCYAQDDQVVRVGVTALGSASGITGVAARDHLVKTLNKQKKAQVQAVPIDATGDKMSAEAREKNCAFLLSTTLTEASGIGGASGKPGQTSNVPEFHANVDYKLYRVSDATVAASGSGKAHDVGSQGDVVLQALDHVATKVVADIKTAKTATATK
jgi:hypothetical protein